MGRKLKGAHVGLLGAEALRPFILFITRDSGSRVVRLCLVFLPFAGRGEGGEPSSLLFIQVA